MLPDHVNVVLLSATVPNTKEFADWIGSVVFQNITGSILKPFPSSRTKKKDIYVISTPKRPVPLEHFLYAGKDIFKIVDQKGEFLGQGSADFSSESPQSWPMPISLHFRWKDASEALRRKQDKEREAAGLPPLNQANRGGAQRGVQRAQNRGRGAPVVSRRGMSNGGGPNSNRFVGVDTSLWVHLVGLLKKKELLPVVVFTFSKKKCEEQALSLTNTDLSSAGEKSEIHVMLEKSLGRLQGISHSSELSRTSR
jgi:antiviral helicase SKI2